MRLAVRRPHMVVRDVCVDLGRHDVGMPQERLNAAQIGSAFEQMRGEGVSKLVRRAWFGNPNSSGIRAKQFPHALTREGFSSG